MFTEAYAEAISQREEAPMAVDTNDPQSHYTIISADCHAGGSMDQYREYLEARYVDEFDAWRGRYKNPFRDLQDNKRARNWDDEQRNADLEADGQVGEVVFPNTVPPFFPTGAVIARPPVTKEDLDLRWAGLRAHNRWLVDWCGRFPERRAGIAQIFVNDVDAAVDEVKFAAEHGLRGGVLVPGIPDDVPIEPLYSDVYDPLWKTCEDLGVVVNHHSGTGMRDYGKHPSATMQWMIETGWFAHRPFWQVLMSGVFERFPRLKLVLTEQGCAWLPGVLRMLDGFHAQMQAGRVGEMNFAGEMNLSLRPSEYFERNVWLGVSFPSPEEATAMAKLGTHKVMWGSDYPHHEGSPPYSRELLRMSFSSWAPEDLRQVLSGTIAEVYDFDLEALRPIAERVGPTVEEVATPLDEIPRAATSPAFRRSA
jgi:predicted TIM-barrel fold metal-dependent hydrolase